MFRQVCVIGAILVLMLGIRVASADSVSPKNQALLLLRILAYDHNLASRADKKTITIVVLYRPGVTDSEDTANELLAVMKDLAKTTSIANNAIQMTRLAYAEKTFDADIARAKAAAIYIASGLTDNLPTITGTTRQRKLLSFTGIEDYVESGVSVGFAIHDAKPVISINLPSSRSEGADLDATLLRIAKIVKK